MQNFGVTNKEHYGMLWYFLEWSILESFAGEPLSFLRSKLTWRDYGANGRNIVGQQLSTLLDVTRKMLIVASVCTPCCMLLNVVGQSLKPVKLLAPGKRTQYCCVRLQVALKSTP